MKFLFANHDIPMTNLPGLDQSVENVGIVADKVLNNRLV